MPRAVKQASPKKTRGRPRSEETRKAILRAARELLAEGGPGAVTMEAVAERAGVGKPTLYRSWPDRHAVAMAALMADDAEAPELKRKRTALHALADELQRIVERFSTSTGRHITTLLAAADQDSELSKSFRNHFVLARRAEGRALLERARAEGDIRGDVNLEVALDLLYGPLFFRLLLGHAALDAAFVRRLVRELEKGLNPR
jgi:AcrR family transcriptional regulator